MCKSPYHTEFNQTAKFCKKIILRSKRFRLVSEQRNTEKGDFRF